MPPDPIASTHSTQAPAWKILAEFGVPNQSGSDHLAREGVAAVLNELGLSVAAMERLKSAVAEATLKAVDDRSYSQLRQPVRIRVLILEQTVPGRSWGFFLIHKMEEQEQTHSTERNYLIELFLYRENDLSQSKLTAGAVP